MGSRRVGLGMKEGQVEAVAVVGEKGEGAAPEGGWEAAVATAATAASAASAGTAGMDCR